MARKLPFPHSGRTALMAVGPVALRFLEVFGTSFSSGSRAGGGSYLVFFWYLCAQESKWEAGKGERRGGVCEARRVRSKGLQLP